MYVALMHKTCEQSVSQEDLFVALEDYPALVCVKEASSALATLFEALMIL